MCVRTAHVHTHNNRAGGETLQDGARYRSGWLFFFFSLAKKKSKREKIPSKSGERKTWYFMNIHVCPASPLSSPPPPPPPPPPL